MSLVESTSDCVHYVISDLSESAKASASSATSSTVTTSVASVRESMIGFLLFYSRFFFINGCNDGGRSVFRTDHLNERMFMGLTVLAHFTEIVVFAD